MHPSRSPASILVAAFAIVVFTLLVNPFRGIVVNNSLQPSSSSSSTDDMSSIVVVADVRQPPPEVALVRRNLPSSLPSSAVVSPIERHDAPFIATVAIVSSSRAPTTAVGVKRQESSNLDATPPQQQHSDILVEIPHYGYNPLSCGVQPNRTPIPPYKGCPLPGLNNLLYTQHSRWYCAYREKKKFHLRDRSCNKGTQEPFRFSTILQIDYQGLESVNGRTKEEEKEDGGQVRHEGESAAICWSDISKQDVLPRCTWSDIPNFYGTPDWWKARKLIDFHPVYYKLAHAFVEKFLDHGHFVAVHMRRGDYYTHCSVIKKKRLEPWITFRRTPSIFGGGFRSCYPSMEDFSETVLSAQRDAQLLQSTNESSTTSARRRGYPKIFVATNLPQEFQNQSINIGVRNSIVFFDSKEFTRTFLAGQNVRRLDLLIIELCILSMGESFVFNRFSSLSATAYEMAHIHGKVTTENVKCW